MADHTSARAPALWAAHAQRRALHVPPGATRIAPTCRPSLRSGAPEVEESATEVRPSPRRCFASVSSFVAAFSSCVSVSSSDASPSVRRFGHLPCWGAGFTLSACVGQASSHILLRMSYRVSLHHSRSLIFCAEYGHQRFVNSLYPTLYCLHIGRNNDRDFFLI